MKKIVSLLPSATEIICKLGLRDNLVGVSHECDYPPSVAVLPKATRTRIQTEASSRNIDSQVKEWMQSSNALYTLDHRVLEQLKPDLIITQALCNVCAVEESEVKKVANGLPGLPEVISLGPSSLDNMLQTLITIGGVCAREKIARQVVAELKSRIAKVSARTERNVRDGDRLRVAFLEWIDPLFGPGHWNPEIIHLAGGIDCLGTPGEPSRIINWRDFIEANPDVLFIACCGYPIERTLKDIPILSNQEGWETLSCARNGRVYLSDGNAFFARPGPRLVDSLEILANALYPDIHPLEPGIPTAHQYQS